MRIAYSRRALKQLENIYRYIERDDPKAAKRVVERIAYSITRLRLLPYSGRPSHDPRARLLSVPGLPYVVVHRLRKDVVDILAIFHTAQRRD